MVSKPRIVLTGATGFVGSAIATRAVAQGFSVLALLRDLSKLQASCEVAVCDLTNISPDAIQKIEQFKPDCVIHTAWLGTENTDRNREDFVLANLQSALQLLRIASRAGCKRFIGFGSQAEYAPDLQGDITETSPAYPATSYGITKLACAHMLGAICAQEGMEYAWLRLFASYGAGYKASYVMPYLLECFASGTIPQLRTPHAVWDYIHVEDVAAATLAVATSSQVDGMYNLATGQGSSIGQIALELAQLCHFNEIDQLRAHIESANDIPTRRVANIARLKAATGWQPSISLSEGLKRSIQKKSEGI